MTVIALVGLPGAGKTSTGALVAKWTARDFVDVDAAVHESGPGTASQLLEEASQDANRRLVRQLLADVLDADEDALVALPVDALHDPQLRAELGRAFVIWLRAQPATLVARIEGEEHTAPVDSSPSQLVETMTAEMGELYEGISDLVIDTDSRDVDNVGRCIVDSLRAYGYD